MKKKEQSIGSTTKYFPIQVMVNITRSRYYRLDYRNLGFSWCSYNIGVANSERTELDLAKLSCGIYYLKLTRKDKLVVMRVAVH